MSLKCRKCPFTRGLFHRNLNFLFLHHLHRKKSHSNIFSQIWEWNPGSGPQGASLEPPVTIYDKDWAGGANYVKYGNVMAGLGKSKSFTHCLLRPEEHREILEEIKRARGRSSLSESACQGIRSREDNDSSRLSVIRIVKETYVWLKKRGH